MAKYKAVYLLMTVAFFIGVAPAQKAHTSTAGSKADYGAATKPLTPKSAMPAKHSSSSLPPATKRSVEANKELTHLEQPRIRSGASSKSAASPAKSLSTPKPVASQKDSGINATYEKPKVGMQASRPDAHAANSTKPRVNKN